ncbi:magnesium chelatase domain-containing protein [Streptomyces eurythermus]
MATTTLREFIIVGQCQGTGFTLWDIAPAPTDPARRAAVLEEIGVDAADALGDVNTERGATAREAVDNFLARMRRQSGLDDYGLTPGSRMDRIDETDAFRAHGASGRGIATITATVKPGTDSLTIAGTHPYESGIVHQRIRGGIVRAGITFPAGEVTATIDDHQSVTETLDLATTCAILAAAGQIDRCTLDRVVCLGGIGWDGYVHSVLGLGDAARTAHTRGYRTVVVPADKSRDVHALGLGLDVIGVRHIREAIERINELAASV